MTSSAFEQFAIVVAGGSGKRMGSQIPKQFMDLGGKPIILHTINKFIEADCRVFVVLPKDHFKTFEELCLKHRFDISKVTIVEGGKERYDSVKNALHKIESTSGFVAVHDAVRPFISVEKIKELFDLTVEKKAVVPVVKLKDSLRMLVENTSKNVNRDDFVAVQTPQIFELGLLKMAYSGEIPQQTTDDASLVELAGREIFLVEGDFKNIKITTPEDLLFAEFLISQINTRLH